MSQQIFELKGNLFTLSVLHLNHYDLSLLTSQLKEKVSQAPKFFEGAPIVVNLASLPTENINFGELSATLAELNFNLVAICDADKSQQLAAKEAGLSVLNYAKDTPNKPATESQQDPQRIIEKEVYLPAQIVKSTVRSGQQVYAKDRDLIILGSVSHGAEVIADGNVHIYGTLRGRAIAGAKGDSQAMIFCQKLEAELVSVDGNYWLSESLQGNNWGKAVKISTSEESLNISALI